MALCEVEEDVEVADGSALAGWVGPLRGQDKDSHVLAILFQQRRNRQPYNFTTIERKSLGVIICTLPHEPCFSKGLSRVMM